MSEAIASEMNNLDLGKDKAWNLFQPTDKHNGTARSPPNIQFL